jgi:hypothetical protein
LVFNIKVGRKLAELQIALNKIESQSFKDDKLSVLMEEIANTCAN